MRPKVSIIIPVYNKKQYIDRCIHALANQEFKDFEIIIVDDGSTDGSGELLDHIIESDISKKISVYHQLNQGVSVARNKGLALAHGEWIWFVDADDVPNSIWLRQIEKYMHGDERDIIFSDFIKVSSDGFEEKITSGLDGTIGPDDLSRYYMEQEYKTGFFGYLWCKLLRKDFIVKASAKFQPGLTLAEDLKFMVSLYRHNPRCLFTNDIAMRYTVEATNSSKEKQIDYREQLVIQYDVFQWLNETAYGERYHPILRNKISYYVAFVFFYAFEEIENISNEKEWILQHPEYLECLDFKGMSGIMKYIVILIQRHLFIALQLLLKARMIMRKIYRSVVI